MTGRTKRCEIMCKVTKKNYTHKYFKPIYLFLRILGAKNTQCPIKIKRNRQIVRCASIIKFQLN